MIEYFWEYDYKFGEFLKKIFPNTYKRKYSMAGNGIYNLILINDKIYEVKFSETKAMLEDNNKLTTDALKNKIIKIHQLSWWFFIFGHSPHTIGYAQVRI